MYSRCYFCGQKFTLPQELSRHIRDKVCKTDEKNQIEVCHEAETLNAMSLLDLPIITDIPQDADLLVTSHQSHASTSAGETATETATVEEKFMIIEHGSDLNMDEQSQSNAKNHSNDEDQTILWGCKQCEFRFVKLKYH